MKRVLLTTAIVVAAAVAAPTIVTAESAVKEGGHPRIEKMFERHDSNQDGKVTKDEMTQHRADWFDKLDLDKDGALTLKEAREGHAKLKEQRKAEMMLKIDPNGDGLVSEAEFTSFSLERFKEADENKDGNLSADEREKMHRHKGFGKRYRMHRG